jgi:uncharacterized protein YhbP (UPF0306 family)
MIRGAVGQHLEGIFAALTHDGVERKMGREKNVVSLEVDAWTEAAYRVYDKPRRQQALYILTYEQGADGRPDATPLEIEGEFRLVNVLRGDDAREEWRRRRALYAMSTSADEEGGLP